MTLKFRREGELPKCLVVGCKAYPGRKLYGRDFCEAHAQEFSEIVSERLLHGVRQRIKDAGIDTELHFYDDAGGAEWTKLKCSVRPCEKLAVGGSSYIVHGHAAHQFLYLCADHNKIVQANPGKDYASELLWEWTQRKKIPTPDSDFEKRKEAIRKSAAKHQGEPNYAANVCRDLREQGIPMPLSWRERWEKKYNLRFEPSEWPRAYADKRLKQVIQNYIYRYK